MKRFTYLLGSLLLAVPCMEMPCSAQCNAPEVVGGADKYDVLVCQGVAASRNGEDQKALGFFLAASQQPVLESPNILLFGRIAETYARLGQFREADLYLKYDDLSLLWLFGVVRCQVQSHSNDESLFQDGKPLKSDEAKHMANVLCGPIFDNDAYFGDRDAESFISAARAILRYDTLRKEIDLMRAKQLSKRQ